MDGRIHFDVSLGAFCVKAWIGTFPDLAIDMRLGTSFNDGIIRARFLSIQKIGLCNCHPTAVLSNQHCDKATTLLVATQNGKRQSTNHVKEAKVSAQFV